MDESEPPPGPTAPNLPLSLSSHKTEGTFEASSASTFNSGVDCEEKNDLEQPESIFASKPPPLQGIRLVLLSIGYVPSHTHFSSGLILLSTHSET